MSIGYAPTAPGNGRNGAGAVSSLPDFSVVTPSLLGAHYRRLSLVPYQPDLLRVAQDPLLSKRGLTVYDEMLRDDMVEAGLQAVFATVLTAARTSPADDTAEAKAIADFFDAQIRAIPGGFLSKLHDTLLALAYGFSVQEIQFGLWDKEPHFGWVCLRDLHFRLPHFFDFASDEDTGALLGLYQCDTWGQRTEELPLEKALYYVWNDWADPFRGRSALRPAYEHYFAKQAFLRFRNIQGERAVGKLKVKQTEAQWKHQDVTFRDYCEKLFREFQGASGWAELFGTETEVVNNEMSPAIFSEVIDHCNRAILRAIGVPPLAIEEGQRVGSMALGKVHLDSMTSKFQRLKMDVEELIREQLFRRICQLNGIPMSLCPGLDLSPQLEEDKAASVTLYIQAVQSGAITARPQDQNWVRERIGLPEIDETELAQPAAGPSAAVAPPAQFAEGGGQFAPGGGRVPGSGGASGGGSSGSGESRSEDDDILDEWDRVKNLPPGERYSPETREQLHALVEKNRPILEKKAEEIKAAKGKLDQARAEADELERQAGDGQAALVQLKPEEREAHSTATAERQRLTEESERLSSEGKDRESDRASVGAERAAAKAERLEEKAMSRASRAYDRAADRLSQVEERYDTARSGLEEVKGKIQDALEEIEWRDINRRVKARRKARKEPSRDHSEAFAHARPLTPAESRIDFAEVGGALDRLVERDRKELSGLWERAVESLRREVLGWAKSDAVSPAQMLKRAQRMSLDLEPFRGKLVGGALEAYGAGRQQAGRELGLTTNFDARVSPPDPYSLGHYQGLLEARSFEVAAGMEAKVYSAIRTALMNSFENGDTLPEAITKLDQLFSALAAGQLIAPGTPGYDFSQPAIQETTTRTLYNDAMNGGRNDLYERNPEFVLGTQRSEVLDTRNHPLSPIVDGLTIKLADPRRRKLTGSLHFNDRGVDIPVTAVDAEAAGFAWSSDGEIDAALAAKARLSPRFV
jgi:hypothetical protein